MLRCERQSRTAWIEFTHDGQDIREPDLEVMAARLLMQGVLFIGSMLVNDGTPSALQVMCSDTFAYACADSEPVTRKEIADVYVAFDAHGWHGVIAWCAKKRGERPLPQIVDAMRGDGTWSDALEALPWPQWMLARGTK